MSIRVRLTALVTLLTAAVCGISLWLGLGVLRGVAADGALDPQLEALDAWVESSESDVFLGPDELRTVRDEIQFLFRAETDWEPTVSPATTAALIGEFGVDDVVYVSATGFIDSDLDSTEWAWPVDTAGIVGSAQEASDVPNSTAIVPVPVLFELIDYSVFDEIDLLGDDGDFEEFDLVEDGLVAPPDGESDGPTNEPFSRLAFERVEIDGVLYGVAADATDELSAIDSVSGFLWASAGLLVLLAAAATWFTSGRALAPVDAMTRKVEVLSSSDLQERLPGADRSDEIGSLAATLNGMLARLEHSDRRRRRFVSDASHELRTPLAVLTNQAEVARSAPDSTSLDQLAAVVENESARLTSIVEDLLLLARHDEVVGLGSAGVNGTTVVFDFDDVVLEEITRPRRLPVDGSTVSAGRVRGDAVAAARAVGHLLDNAARHGRTTVAVSLTTTGDRVQLTVEDDGEGIPDSRRAEVFERFTRLDDSRSRDRGGAGLGLSVVNATFSAMGGTVAVDGSVLGGARFRVTLPAA